MKSIALRIVLGLVVSVFPGFAVGADTGCAAAAAQAMPLCTVLANDKKYEGRQVTVEGLYRKTSRQEILTSPDCDPSSVDLREARDYKADKHVLASLHSLSQTKKGKSKSVKVVIRGTFRIADQGQCMGHGCMLYGLDQHELMCAEPGPPEPEKPPAAETGDDLSK